MRLAADLTDALRCGAGSNDSLLNRGAASGSERVRITAVAEARIRLRLRARARGVDAPSEALRRMHRLRAARLPREILQAAARIPASTRGLEGFADCLGGRCRHPAAPHWLGQALLGGQRLVV
jgi:hypothetical protein